MTRRGFALVAVLWVVVALAGLALTATSRARVAGAAAEARVVFVRGRWAAEACLAVAHARLDERAAEGLALQPLAPDTIALADGSRCTVAMVDSTMMPPDSLRAARRAATPRLQLQAFGWFAGAPHAARIDLLVVAAGTRVAPIRKRLW
jgi:hypothetical protein